MPEMVEGATTNWYLFVINVEDQAGFRKYMSDNGVQTDVHFPTPPFLQPALAYLGHGEGSFPIAEKDCKTVISLPMMDYMSDEEIETVIKVVNAYEG